MQPAKQSPRSGDPSRRVVPVTEDFPDQPEWMEVIRAGSKVLVRIGTPLDTVSSRPLLDRLERLAQESAHILIDLRRCEFIDSDGVRALWSLHGQMAARQGELRLVVLPGSRIQRTLRLLRLDGVLHLYDSAVTAWRQ